MTLDHLQNIVRLRLKMQKLNERYNKEFNDLNSLFVQSATVVKKQHGANKFISVEYEGEIYCFKISDGLGVYDFTKVNR